MVPQDPYVVHLYNRYRRVAVHDSIECPLPGPVYSVFLLLQHSYGVVALHDGGDDDGGSLSATRPSGSLPVSNEFPSLDLLSCNNIFSFDKHDLKQ
jgi:hypothetical protein